MIPFNTFCYGNRRIRVIPFRNAIWFDLGDVCQIFNLGDAAMVASTLADHEQTSLDLNPGHPRRRGTQNLILINGLGLTHLLGGLRHPEAEPFLRWARTVVIPSMQKGGDLPEQDSMDMGGLPSVENPPIQNIFAGQDTERQLQELLCENAKLKAVIHDWTPKVQYYNAVLQSPDAIPISMIAKDYGLSPQALNTYLYQRGIQYPCHGTWLLYQRYANEGYTTSRTALDNSRSSQDYTYWTQKGRAFIHDLLKEDGILPLSERSNDSGGIGEFWPL